ncbi:MAG: SPW repeat protein, partial [Actinomycetes bacterium]
MELHFIQTRVHGPLDYLVGIVLIVAPWIFGFSDVDSAKWTAIGV